MACPVWKACLLVCDTNHNHTFEFQAAQITSEVTAFRQAVYDELSLVDGAAAARYKKCGEFSGWVRYCDVCESENLGFPAYPIPLSCMSRICPSCAQRVVAPVRNRYRPIIEYLFQHPKRDYRVRGITLTRSIELDRDSGTVAREILDQAMELCQRMILNDPNAGVLLTLEVGERGGKYHVHIIAYCRYIPYRDLSRVWEDISGDYVVWIREYPDAEAAIREGLKYITKFQNMTPKQLVDLHVALKGTRRIRAAGIFYMSKHNPLRELIEKHEPNRCPVCASKMTTCHELEFLRLANDHTHEYVTDVPLACKLVRWTHTLLLHSTEAIKFPETPP